MNKNEDLLSHFVFEDSPNLKVGENDYIFCSSIQERINAIDQLKKMNIFVGANNSGKSRILRGIFIQNGVMDLGVVEDLEKFILGLNALFDSTRIARGQLPKTDKFISRIKSQLSKKFWDFDTDHVSNLRDVWNEMQEAIKNPGVFAANNAVLFPSELMQMLDANKELFDALTNQANRHRLYIPTLRGMRPVVKAEDTYAERTKRDYFKVGVGDFKRIFSGFTIYSDIRKKLLGRQSERDFIDAYEKFLSENFFENTKITLIPRETDNEGEENDVIYITFDGLEDKERPIFQLGDGLQTIVCITYPLFSWIKRYSKENNVFLTACIEEPELYLHPSMQQKLIKVLMSNEFKKIQYFITTHSNHFISLVNENEFSEMISIFSVFQKDGTKFVKGENDISDAVYNLLGAKPSSLLLANKTVWIEGVSDRIYLRHAMNLFFEKNKDLESFIKPSEYSDYAFVEYGGSNLEHYFEGDESDLKIQNLSNLKNVFLLVDTDDTVKKTDSKKNQRYSLAEKEITDGGGFFKKTDGREMENYLTPAILKKIYSALPENLKLDDYKNEILSKFLFRKKLTSYIKTDGSGFRDKASFAKKAIVHQKDWDDLSEDMQKVVEEIYKFILD